MSYFEDETALTPIAPGRWTGQVSADWNIADNPNGGYLVSIVLRAATHFDLPHPDPLTITTHFLRPGIPGETCEVTMELIRVGRTLCTLRATLTQQGKPRLEMLATFGDLTSSTDDTHGLTLSPPPLPPPDVCLPRSGEIQGIELPLLKRLEVRLDPAEARGGLAGQAQVSGWIRFSDALAPSTHSLVLFADAFPPSLFGLLGVIGWVPTIELTVHVRRRPVPGWICGRFRTRDLSGNLMIEDGLLWDEKGFLVAQARQLGLLLDRGG